MNHLANTVPKKVSLPTQRISAQSSLLSKQRTRYDSATIGTNSYLGGQDIRVNIQSSNGLDMNSAWLCFNARPQHTAAGAGGSLYTSATSRATGTVPPGGSYFDAILGVAACFSRCVTRLNGQVIDDSGHNLQELVKLLILNMPCEYAEKAQHLFGGCSEVGQIHNTVGKHYDALVAYPGAAIAAGQGGAVTYGNAAAENGALLLPMHVAYSGKADEYRARMMSPNDSRNLYCVPMSLFSSLCRADSGVIDFSMINSLEFVLTPAASLADVGVWNVANNVADAENPVVNLSSTGAYVEDHDASTAARGRTTVGLHNAVCAGVAATVDVEDIRISNVHIMVDAYVLSAEVKQAMRSLASNQKGMVFYLPSYRLSTHTLPSGSTANLQLQLAGTHARGCVFLPRTPTRGLGTENDWQLLDGYDEYSALNMTDYFTRLGDVTFPSQRVSSIVARKQQLDSLFGNQNKTTVLDRLGRSHIYRYQQYAVDWTQAGNEAVSALNLSSVGQNVSFEAKMQRMRDGDLTQSCTARSLICVVALDGFLVMANGSLYPLL